MSDPAGALAPILVRKREEAARLRCGAAAIWARAKAAPPARGFVAALSPGSVIAEMKRRSPSGGELRGELDVAAVARAYAGAGAAGLSVLTDGPAFGGGLSDLVAAREAVAVPVLRKDFVVDPVQVAEARAAGADCVLLIVAALGAGGLEECLEAARRCGVDAVVEVHDAREAAVAVAAGAVCIGVNNRDLRSLTTDLGNFARVRAGIPAETLCLAESGVRDAGDVARLIGEGATAVLVGEILMRSPDPGAACAELVAAAQAAAARA